MKNNRKHILIVVPPLWILGGVALHYAGLKNYWKENVEYYQSFKSIRGTNKGIAKVSLLFDVIKFSFILLLKNPDIVVINISLKKGFYSKSLYMCIAKLFKKKIITFIHGWDVNSEWMLTSKKGKKVIQMTDGFIVLSKQFRTKLINLGIKQPILVSTTKVDDDLLNNFNINTRNGKIKNFLFLSRIEKAKGIFLSLDIFKMLQRDNANLAFYIAGEGKALKEVEQYIAEKKILNVHLLGRIDGEDISKAYSQADCFFLLSESEGMPAALLEAMAFGLPIITKPVGGIPDFFIDGEMGVMSDEQSPSYYYERIKKIINNRSRVVNISIYNYSFAKDNFYASIVANKLENYFNTFLQ